MNRAKVWIVFFVLGLSGFVTCASAEATLQAGIYASNKPDLHGEDEIVREYLRNETASCIFFAKGFSRDSQGGVSLSADVTATGPKGVIFEQKDYASATGIAAADRDVINLNKALDITFEPIDPLGLYVIEVTLRDNNARTEDTVRMTLLLFDTPESRKLVMEPVKDAAQLDALWTEYFRSGHPWAVKRIISALSLRKAAQELDMAVVGSAAEWSLEANARKHPELLAIYKESASEAKGAIQELLLEIIGKVEK